MCRAGTALSNSPEELLLQSFPRPLTHLVRLASKPLGICISGVIRSSVGSEAVTTPFIRVAEWVREVPSELSARGSLESCQAACRGQRGHVTASFVKVLQSDYGPARKTGHLMRPDGTVGFRLRALWPVDWVRIPTVTKERGAALDGFQQSPPPPLPQPTRRGAWLDLGDESSMRAPSPSQRR